MITVTGSLAFDYIMDFPGKFSDHIMPDKIHQLNLSFLINSLKKMQGGTAGNIAYNLSLLQMPVQIIGTAGEDFSPYLNFLKTAGVDISQIKIIPDQLTSSAFIITDRSDNQITAFHPGPMTQNWQLSLNSTRSDLVVISPNDPEAMVKFAKECQQYNLPYLFDPGMQLPRLSAKQLKHAIQGVKILIANDYEMELLSEKLKVKSEKLIEQAEIVITTLGAEGAKIQTSAQTYQIKPAKPDQVIDPTGAGDAFRAGFLTGLIKGFDLPTCGQMGALTACYTIEKYGTTTHAFTVEEFCQRYQDNYQMHLKL